MYTHKFRDTNENKYSAEDNPVIIKMDFFPPCAVQLLGSQFPDQGLNPGSCNESPDLKPLGHQGTPNTMLIFREVEKSNQIAT